MPIYVGENNNATILQTSGSTQFGNSSDDLHNIYGTLIVTGTISGSIHHTQGGLSYLVAGSNVTITSASNGQVTVASSGGGGGISWDGSTANGVATYKDSDEATVESNLTFDGNTLTVSGDVSGDYVAVIDNDESSAGHGLKVTSDGTSTGTYLLELESASSSILRVRGDGSVGIGATTMGQKLTVEGDIGVASDLIHKGDSDTKIAFTTDDISIQAGGVEFIKITEDDSQDKIVFNDGAADIDFIVESPNESKALYLHAENEVFHINHGESNFQTKIHNTNDTVFTVDSTGAIFNDDSHASIDFRIESDSNTHMFFLDSGNDKIGINTSAPDKDLEINNSSGGAIRLTYNDSDGSASDYADISVGANGALTLATTDSDGLAGDLTLDADGDIYLNADNGTVVFADDTTSYMTITNNSSHSFIRPLATDKDIQLATADSNIAATVDSSLDGFAINRKMFLGADYSNSTGLIESSCGFNIIDSTSNNVDAHVANAETHGQIKVVMHVGQNSNSATLHFTGSSMSATTKSLTKNTGVLLVSLIMGVQPTWLLVGDVS